MVKGWCQCSSLKPPSVCVCVWAWVTGTVTVKRLGPSKKVVKCYRSMHHFPLQNVPQTWKCTLLQLVVGCVNERFWLPKFFSWYFCFAFSSPHSDTRPHLCFFLVPHFTFQRYLPLSWGYFDCCVELMLCTRPCGRFSTHLGEKSFLESMQMMENSFYCLRT